MVDTTEQEVMVEEQPDRKVALDNLLLQIKTA
jgi:hypothetical protein